MVNFAVKKIMKFNKYLFQQLLKLITNKICSVRSVKTKPMFSDVPNKSLRRYLIVLVFLVVGTAYILIKHTFDVPQPQKSKTNMSTVAARQYSSLCNSVKRGQDFLPPIESIPPPADSIFFLETSCKGSLSIRQSCAIESVARIHPNRDVYVLFSAPVPYSEKLSSISQLMEFQNIKLAVLNVAEYAKGTGLDEVLAQVNKFSYWPMEHTTDILKFLTLFKYGGVYIDTDMLVVKPLDDLGKNWVARQDTDLVNGAVVAIGQDELGKEFSEGIINDIKRTYNPAVWVSTESDKLLGALMRLCNASSIQLESFSECHGMQIYEPDMFFPVPYLKVASYFLPGGLSTDVVDKAYAHHFWNEDTRLLVVRPGAPYQELAEKHCPTVVGLGDYFDGSV